MNRREKKDFGRKDFSRRINIFKKEEDWEILVKRK